LTTETINFSSIHWQGILLLKLGFEILGLQGDNREEKKSQGDIDYIFKI
jgi:hypothetical protein